MRKKIYKEYSQYFGDFNVHIFIVLVLVMGVFNLVGKSNVYFPTDLRLTEERFLIGNQWPHVLNKTNELTVEAIANELIYRYGNNEWPVFTSLSNDANSEYYRVGFTDHMKCSRYVILPNIEGADAELVSRITNDGILDGYDATRLRQSIMRGGAFLSWYISNDIAYIGEFGVMTNNRELQSNISSWGITLPLDISVTGNKNVNNYELGIGAGYWHAFDGAVFGINALPFTYFHNGYKITSNSYVDSDFAWQTSGEFILRTQMFLIYDRFSYYHCQSTGYENNVATTSGAAQQTPMRITNDAISNIVMVGTKLWLFRFYYSFEGKWNTANGVFNYYSTNGNITNTLPYSAPWQSIFMNSIRVAFTDKKMSFGNNTTFYIDSTWKWPNLEITNSLFTHRLFGNLNLDELFSISIYGYVSHYLDGKTYMNKIADSSYISYALSEKTEMPLRGYDMHLEVGFNYWNWSQLGILSLSMAMTRMRAVIQGNESGFTEYRAGMTWRLQGNLLTLGAEYRFNFSANQIFIEKNWYDNFVFKARIQLPFTEADFDKFDIVRIFIE